MNLKIYQREKVHAWLSREIVQVVKSRSNVSHPVKVSIKPRYVSLPVKAGSQCHQEQRHLKNMVFNESQAMQDRIVP
jgi:hypothetical protein